MKTECIVKPMGFHVLEQRDVIGKFDGGRISSDGGGVLLREVEHRTHILKRLSECFTDHRDPDRIEHSVESLVKQRVMGIALGYEDLNDHDVLRHFRTPGCVVDYRMSLSLCTTATCTPSCRN